MIFARQIADQHGLPHCGLSRGVSLTSFRSVKTASPTISSTHRREQSSIPPMTTSPDEAKILAGESANWKPIPIGLL
jgi:hypothetical protein